MDIKNHKGKLSGIAFTSLTIFMFGIMPVPMLCYGLVSSLGEIATIINKDWDPKIVGIIFSTLVLLVAAILVVFQMKRSRKKFDWFIALLLICFVFLNGIGLKGSELLSIDFSQNSFLFFSKIAVYYFWIFPAIGWYYDSKLAPQNTIQD